MEGKKKRILILSLAALKHLILDLTGLCGLEPREKLEGK